MAKEKDIIEKIVKVITEYFNSTNSSEGEYWDADEQTFEYKIKFKPIEMLINKNKGDFKKYHADTIIFGFCESIKRIYNK